MKKFLFNWSRSFSYDKYLSNMVLLLIGLLIISGGRIGIQATPESEVQWIEAFGLIDAWIGWVIVWMTLDNVLTGGKMTTFLLSKTVAPVVRVVLINILGEERLNALKRRFKKKEKDKPL